MADEKLPDDLDLALIELMNRTCGCVSRHSGNGSEEHADLVAAIHRYAREREAAALERAAQVCDRVAGGGEMKTIGLPFTHDGGKVYDHGANYCAWEIRALIHKEPANG